MMRGVLVGLVALAGLARPAHGMFVVEGPAVVAACGRGKTWAVVRACLARQGEVTIERTLPKAKLVRVVQIVDKQRSDQGVYLYVEGADASWSIGGMYKGSGYTVLALTPQTIGTYTGYRISIGEIHRENVVVGGGLRSTLMLTQRAVFCAGQNEYCTHVVTHCDVLAHGRAREMFRGSLSFSGSSIMILGDRRLAVTRCQQSPRVEHHWPIPPPPPVKVD